MAPPWVLLHRNVNFVDGGFAGDSDKAAAAIGGSSREPSLEEAVAAMESYPVVADPPEVTCLSMLRWMPADQMQRVHSGTISSTNKGLVVLYTGMYRPGNGAYSPRGCYLVYDASSNSVSTIPQLDPPITGGPCPVLPTIKCLGPSAAILRHGHGGEGTYVLVELVTTFHPGLPDAELYLWWSSSSTANPDGQWVDLLTGVLVCDLFAPQGAEFSFIPLPEGCCLYTPDDLRLGLKPQEFRSIGCVCGAIKLVALIGYSEGLPSNEVALKTWTLSPDLMEWKNGSVVQVADLWASKSFNQMELPRVRPMGPVLSMNEDDIIYVFLNEIEFVEEVNDFGQIIGRRLMLNGNYVLRLD